jgi:DNA-binding beta-propeller fold protein YncE
MTRTRSLLIATTLGLSVVAGTLDFALAQRGAPQLRSPTAPTYVVDPLWPKPLPNHWILGSVTGVAVDTQDHIWIVHRGLDSLTQGTEAGTGTTPPTAELCCAPAPAVLEFDAAGTLVNQWGPSTPLGAGPSPPLGAGGPGQGYDWPISPGAISVDAKGNVWITAAGLDPGSAGRGGGRRGGAAAAPAAPRPGDAHVLKFSRDGKFLLQIGKPGVSEGSNSTTSLSRPAGVEVDLAANEVFVADGLGTHRRVVVFDATTGAYKRHWGAYGAKPDDAAPAAYDPDAPPAKQFRSVSCVALAKDGQLYVCDRGSDRIQVFKKDGAFVKEGVISKATKGLGSVWDIAFSNDTAQQFLFVPSAMDERVLIVRRDTLEEVGAFGDGGRQPGLFRGVSSVALDSKGNLYTGETFEGKRVQKWMRK